MNSFQPISNIVRSIKDMLAALAAGAGAVPFGDNGKLFRDLAELRRQRQPPPRRCDA